MARGGGGLASQEGGKSGDSGGVGQIPGHLVESNSPIGVVKSASMPPKKRDSPRGMAMSHRTVVDGEVLWVG
ncbi:MAG: hypothetical protein LC721_01510 [Actinobacteria bacterium]|nr:hypothetical protein [Actinomycetota bacterium]